MATKDYLTGYYEARCKGCGRRMFGKGEHAPSSLCKKCHRGTVVAK